MACCLDSHTASPERTGEPLDTTWSQTRSAWLKWRQGPQIARLGERIKKRTVDLKFAWCLEVERPGAVHCKPSAAGWHAARSRARRSL